MFYRAIIALAISLIATVVYHIRITAESKREYEQLTASTNELRSKPPLTQIEQKRTAVQKDFWGKASHIRMNGQSSTLWIQQHGGKFEIREELQGVQCDMQEGDKAWQSTADSAHIMPNSPRELLRLCGNVRLAQQEAFAIADELIYDAKEKTLLCTAKPPKKVLFWQNDLQISAPQLQIQRDPTSHTPLVTGLGDVHCSFDAEEKKTIEEMLDKWLPF